MGSTYILSLFFCQISSHFPSLVLGLSKDMWPGLFGVAVVAVKATQIDFVSVCRPQLSDVL